MRTAVLSAAVLALLVSTPARADEGADAALSDLTERYTKFQRSQAGGRENAPSITELPAVTPEAHQARAKFASEMLSELEKIAHADLSEKAKIDAAVFRTLLEHQIGDAQFREWEMPFNSDINFWSYRAGRRGYGSVAEYEAYIEYMRELPRYFGQHTENARAGLERGFSVPRVTLLGRDVSLEAYLADEAENNPFWVPFAQMPETIPADEAERLKAQGRAAIQDSVVPAYSQVLSFFREEYLPQTRETLAASEMPDGPAYYAQQIRQFTTLDIGAEEIHRIGLEEVARITAEMEEVKEAAGFEGTLDEFVIFLRTDSQFVAKTPDELMGIAAYTAKRVDGELGRYFGFLPRHRHAIRPVDPAIAPFYTAGRGGLEYCQINTYDLPSRPVYNIPALTMHECAPGHSFQAAIALEQPAVEPFRRNVYFSGFGEGWGLYTEYLGEEMGIYRTPYERFGKLSYEMWRAARLVIDTGIHHYGWSRGKAIDYLGSRTALSDHEVNTEVDRYISWPGQAVAYKLGEMTIRRLRAKAESELGDAFDIRKFHDVILSLGSVPLSTLETRIEGFIADGGQGLPNVEY